MSDSIHQPSQAEKHALVEAASAMENHGVGIALPWEGTLDDREKELYEGLVLASRAYSKVLIAWWIMNRGYATGHGGTVEDMLVELEGQMRKSSAQGQEIERLRDGLDAAIRAAKLALFVIRKQGVMPNSSWESGFNSDLAKAKEARGDGQ